MLDETTIRKRIEALKDETMSRLGINSVDEFLERTGMKRSAFYELINGKTRIVNRHLRELAAAFEVTEEYLLLGYDPVREEELHDQDYYDNSITLVVKRKDGSVFFDRKFTKKDFESVLPKIFRDNGVLLGMNLEKVDGNNLRFVVSVGSPDENNEEFYLIMLTVNNQGQTKTETYQVPEEEDTTV